MYPQYPYLRITAAARWLFCLRWMVLPFILVGSMASVGQSQRPEISAPATPEELSPTAQYGRLLDILKGLYWSCSPTSCSIRPAETEGAGQVCQPRFWAEVQT